MLGASVSYQFFPRPFSKWLQRLCRLPGRVRCALNQALGLSARIAQTGNAQDWRATAADPDMQQLQAQMPINYTDDSRYSAYPQYLASPPSPSASVSGASSNEDYMYAPYPDEPYTPSTPLMQPPQIQEPLSAIYPYAPDLAPDLEANPYKSLYKTRSPLASRPAYQPAP